MPPAKYKVNGKKDKLISFFNFEYLPQNQNWARSKEQWVQILYTVFSIHSLYIDIYICTIKFYIYYSGFLYRRSFSSYCQDKTLFYSYSVSIYKFEVYTDNRPYLYAIFIYKDECLISWEITIQLVKINIYFGLMIQPCRCNQLLEEVIIIIAMLRFKFYI